MLTTLATINVKLNYLKACHGVGKKLHLPPLSSTLTTLTHGATMMMITMMSLKDKVKRIQELRRSNAAQPVRNKKKYTRKLKYRKEKFND